MNNAAHDAAADKNVLAEASPSDQAFIEQTERFLAATHRRPLSDTPLPPNFVRVAVNDNRPLRDGHGRPVSVERILATKPLREDVSTRLGPGGRKLTYMSGDAVSRLLNEVFGYDGWSLTIEKVTQTSQEQDRGRWKVSYLAHARITLTASGTYKEDMGSGDSMDKSLQAAIGNAIKSSITDALKRAARHFGEKLGNSLYNEDFKIQTAPKTLAEALEQNEREARQRWGTANVPVAPCASTQEVSRMVAAAPVQAPRHSVAIAQMSTSVPRPSSLHPPPYGPRPVGTYAQENEPSLGARPLESAAIEPLMAAPEFQNNFLEPVNLSLHGKRPRGSITNVEEQPRCINPYKKRK